MVIALRVEERRVLACRGKTGVFTFGSRVGSLVLSRSTQSTRRSNDHHRHSQRRAYLTRSLPSSERISILDRHRTTGDAHPRNLTPPHQPYISMTAAIVTRTPLHNLSMTGAQTNGINKRKSQRHHNDNPDEDDRPVKKSKPTNTTTSSRNASQNTLKKPKKCKFAVVTNTDAQLLMRLRPAYDDDDDGFVFTRLRPKKAKGKTPDVVPEQETTAGASAPAPEVQPAQQLLPPTDEHAPIEATQPPRKKVRKTLPASPEPTPRRRSKRLSGNSPVHDQAPATSKPATESQSHQQNPATPPPAPTNDENVAPAADGSPALDQGELTIHKKRGPAKIPLPFGETPVLRRNKEMRKLSAEKSRRSSSGMRGRRASSLIEAGSSRGTWILFVSPFSSICTILCFLFSASLSLGLVSSPDIVFLRAHCSRLRIQHRSSEIRRFRLQPCGYRLEAT